jgi:hypothetical protein
MEMIYIRRILGPLMGIGRSCDSFPPSIMHFNLYNVCVHAMKEIKDFQAVMENREELIRLEGAVGSHRGCN